MENDDQLDYINRKLESVLKKEKQLQEETVLLEMLLDKSLFEAESITERLDRLKFGDT